jgi:hypothetical protein
MTVATITCPHCGASNLGGSAFCESCGKALPAPISTGPRIVAGAALPASAAGHELVTDELRKQVKKASKTLLAVGILQLVCGMSVLGYLSQARGVPPAMIKVLAVAQLVVAGIFIGLYFWARRSPLPATIAGLVVYVTLVALNVFNALTQIGETQRSGIGGIGIGWLDIVIIAFLAQGIQAALKHKRLTAGNPVA